MPTDICRFGKLDERAEAVDRALAGRWQTVPVGGGLALRLRHRNKFLHANHIFAGCIQRGFRFVSEQAREAERTIVEKAF
jgi:hypothetical protein